MTKGDRFFEEHVHVAMGNFFCDDEVLRFFGKGR
jgi:hypothetical protein